MDKDGEKTTRCDSTLPEAERLLSSRMIDASPGEDCIAVNGFSTYKSQKKQGYI